MNVLDRLAGTLNGMDSKSRTGLVTLVIVTAVIILFASGVALGQLLALF